MTISNQTNRISATGSGSTGQAVPFSFPINITSDLVVYKRVTATGVQTLLDETTNYTVVISGDIGGTLTTVTAIETTEQIHLVRNTPNTQELDLVQGGSFNAENIEDALDKNTKLAIQDNDKLTNKVITFPETDASGLTTELPSSVDRASKNLTFDSFGNVAASDSVETGSVSFTTFGEDMVGSANALAGKAVINLDHMFDVRDYGAVGDGTTDDSTAIQAALDALTDETGTLFFPPGTYKANNITFTTPDGTSRDPKILHILGYGATILNTHASNPTFFCNFDSPGGVVRAGLRFEGLKLDGDGQTTKGFDLTGAINVHINRVTVFDHQDFGIHLTHCWSARITNTVVACPINDLGNIGIVSEGDGGNVTVINTKCLYFGIGFKSFGNTTGGGFWGCDFSSGGQGLEIRGLGPVVISGCFFEENTSRDIIIGSTSLVNGVIIEGCRFFASVASPTEAIFLQRAAHVKIQGCLSTGHDRFIRGGFTDYPIKYDAISDNSWTDTIFELNLISIDTLDDTGTPSIKGFDSWFTGGTTTITDFDDGVEGQIITIIAEHSITITDGTNIFLSANTDWVMAATDVLVLINKADGLWYEIGRSHNESSPVAIILSYENETLFYENEVLTI